MKGKVGILLLLCVIGTIGFTVPLNNAEGIEILPTIIRGRIIDAETGTPVENAYVSATNISKDLHFYFQTTEDGFYELNVGTTGNFSVNVCGPAHHVNRKEVSIQLFDEIDLDFQMERFELDVMLCFFNCDKSYPITHLETIIKDQNGNETTYYTGSDGRLNLTLEYGSYSVRTYRDHLETFEEVFNISRNEVLFRCVSLSPSNVNESASKKLTPGPLLIPPKKFQSIRIDDTGPNSLFLRVRSSRSITVIDMTPMMYDKYLSIHTGIPYLHDEQPCMEFDSRLGPSYGGGGTVRVWKLPYYMVFENNNTVSAEVDIELFYEFGDPYIGGIEEGPLEPPLPDDEEDVSSSLGSNPMLIILISILFVFSLTMIFEKRRK